jgi:hypothetical protein
LQNDHSSTKTSFQPEGTTYLQSVDYYQFKQWQKEKKCFFILSEQIARIGDGRKNAA